MKCKGFLGWLLGHKYVSIYDTDKEQYSAEEKNRMLEATTMYNNAALISYQKSPDSIDDPKRVTKIYKGHICVRCGDIKKEVNLIL